MARSGDRIGLRTVVYNPLSLAGEYRLEHIAHTLNADRVMSAELSPSPELSECPGVLVVQAPTKSAARRARRYTQAFRTGAHCVHTGAPGLSRSASLSVGLGDGGSSVESHLSVDVSCSGRVVSSQEEECAAEPFVTYFSSATCTAPPGCALHSEANGQKFSTPGFLSLGSECNSLFGKNGIATWTRTTNSTSPSRTAPPGCALHDVAKDVSISSMRSSRDESRPSGGVSLNDRDEALLERDSVMTPSLSNFATASCTAPLGCALHGEANGQPGKKCSSPGPSSFGARCDSLPDTNGTATVTRTTKPASATCTAPPGSALHDITKYKNSGEFGDKGTPLPGNSLDCRGRHGIYSDREAASSSDLGIKDREVSALGASDAVVFGRAVPDVDKELVALVLKLLRRKGENAVRLIRSRVACGGPPVTAKGRVFSATVLETALQIWDASVERS